MDVTLAECEGQVWLVGGEEHLDALLIGRLAPELTVGLRHCATRAELFALWQELSPTDTEGAPGSTGAAQPWVINPLITARILGTLGLATGRVRFTPWSAAIDEAGQQAVSAAASWLAANPGGRVLLRQEAATEAGQGELLRLRAQLVLAALVRAGADPARMGEDGETTPEAEVLHLVTVGS